MEVQIGMAAASCAAALRAVHFVKLFVHRAKSGTSRRSTAAPAVLFPSFRPFVGGSSSPSPIHPEDDDLLLCPRFWRRWAEQGMTS